MSFKFDVFFQPKAHLTFCRTDCRFVGSLWYFVISFAITDFLGDKYANVVIAGSLELPVTLVTMFVIKRYLAITAHIYYM